MALKYSREQDMRILDEERLDVGSFRGIAVKAVENDSSIAPGRQKVPRLWENPLFANPAAEGVGYSKGDAVWINTEDPDEFIRTYERQIRELAQANFKTQAELERIDALGDRDAQLEFYKGLLERQDGVGPMFYLGDLSKPAQIRISLVDNNTWPPTDNNLRGENNISGTWRNFFDVATDDQLEAQISAGFQKQIGAKAERHMQDYHCAWLSSVSDFVDGRLASDMGNLRTDHSFRSHQWYSPRLPDGFDFVLQQAFAEFPSGVRWFRRWNSGMLEHGGTVDLTSPDRYCSIRDGIAEINLRWIYLETHLAPAYAFPTDALNQIYLGTRVISPRGTASSSDAPDSEMPRSPMGSKYRFSIQLTPWYGDGDPYSRPTDSGAGGVYFPKEVCYISNDSFRFLANGQASRYSYHLRGFYRP